MKIIVIGCGRVGSELAYRLFQKGHQVTVIDIDESAFDNLNPNFRGRTLGGEALNRDILLRAGIDTADGLVAVTSSDPLNAVVGHLARKAYNMTNVVVRNYDPVYRSLHEAFGLQVISSSSWGAQRIEELLYHADMRAVFSAGNGEIEIYEFSISHSLSGKKLGDLLPENNCAPVSLARAGMASLPTRETVVETGDIILVSATFEGIEAVRNTLISLEEN